MKTEFVETKKCLGCGQYYYSENSGLTPTKCRCKPKSQHTPTPFKVDKGITHNKFLILDSKEEGIAAMYEGPFAEADAVFIVHCVNSHQFLIDTLKEIGDSPSMRSVREIVSEALDAIARVQTQ